MDPSRGSEKLAAVTDALNGSDMVPYPEVATGSSSDARRKGHCYRASGHGVSIAQALPLLTVVVGSRDDATHVLPLTLVFSDAHLHRTDCHHER